MVAESIAAKILNNRWGSFRDMTILPYNSMDY